MEKATKLTCIKNILETPEVKEPHLKLKSLLQEKCPKIEKGQTIGIAVGSRGIYQVSKMVKETVDYVASLNAKPVIIPAMGSHGGATPEGQIEVLASYGVTEEDMGAPIWASMDVTDLGPEPKTGFPVYFDSKALELNGVILFNRVKAHTDFHNTYESGLFKQMVIGLGNHIGARNVHSHGLKGLLELIPAFARVILEKANILCGISVLENSRETTAELHLSTRDEIADKEPELLERSKTYLPSIPFTSLDLLLVQQMGKNISGVGIDPNISKRRSIKGDSDPTHGTSLASRIVCLDLTPESHGNALGMGICDLIPQRLYDKIDFEKTYANVITSGFLSRGFVPLVQKNDQTAIETAITCCGRNTTLNDARIVQIKDTMNLNEIYVSSSMMPEIMNPEAWEVVSELEMTFDDNGELTTLL